MNIRKIVSPTKNKLLLFTALFIGVHVINRVLIYFFAGFFDFGSAIGFPIPFYTLGCGRVPADFICNYGLNLMNLLINILFWYGVTIVIKRNEKTR